MEETDLAELAALLRERNLVDERIGRLINRPMTAGHAGEWIASRIFDIALEPNAIAKAIDGRFRAGPLTEKSVNVKWYLKREGILDMTEAPELDYYLVLTGPKATAKDVRTVRAWRIDAVYLFDSQQLLTEQHARGARSPRGTVAGGGNLPVRNESGFGPDRRPATLAGFVRRVTLCRPPAGAEPTRRHSPRAPGPSALHRCLMGSGVVPAVTRQTGPASPSRVRSMSLGVGRPIRRFASG